MAYFKRNRFSGIAPAISPRLLGDQYGQIAENIDFERGNIKPAKINGGSEWSLSGRKRSIYSYETPFPQEYWLGGCRLCKSSSRPYNHDEQTIVCTDRRWLSEVRHVYSNNCKPSVPNSYKLGVP